MSHARSASSPAGTSSPYAQTTTVGASSWSPGVGPLGLENGDPEPLRDDLRGRRHDAPPAACGRVGPGEERRDVVPRRQPLEHVRPERRRRGDRDAGHALSLGEDEARA